MEGRCEYPPEVRIAGGKNGWLVRPPEEYSSTGRLPGVRKRRVLRSDMEQEKGMEEDLENCHKIVCNRRKE